MIRRSLDEITGDGLTIRDVSEVLGVSPSVIRERIRTGDLAAIQLGKRLVIPRSAVQRLLGEVAPVSPPLPPPPTEIAVVTLTAAELRALITEAVAAAFAGAGLRGPRR